MSVKKKDTERIGECVQEFRREKLELTKVVKKLTVEKESMETELKARNKENSQRNDDKVEDRENEELHGMLLLLMFCFCLGFF